MSQMFPTYTRWLFFSFSISSLGSYMYEFLGIFLALHCIFPGGKRSHIHAIPCTGKDKRMEEKQELKTASVNLRNNAI